MKKLFFVDSIYFSSEDAENAGNEGIESEVIVSLIAVGEAERERENEDNAPIMVSLQRSQLQYDPRGGDIREGWYVFFNDKPRQGELYFSYASRTKLAQEQIRLNDDLRSQLRTASNGFSDIISDDDVQKLLYSSEVRSYHVNVGHGNCSLILIKNVSGCQIWMIDCSIHERQNKKVRYENHQAALDKCMQQIVKDSNMNAQKLHIDRFFLTHMHYDHYNGMKYLIDRGYMDQNTICYINLKYQMASKNMNAILQRMANKGIHKIVEPLTVNSSPAIQILYPERPICRSTGTAIGDCRIEKNVNNSSSVIRFNLGKHTLVCPGDVEQNGLKAMSAYLPYPPYCYADIYVVSHHGSFNGHPSFKPVLVPPFMRKGKYMPYYTLFMGRDGAYNGIYSTKVKNFFSQISWPILTDMSATGRSLSFVMIDWQNGNVTMN